MNLIIKAYAIIATVPFLAFPVFYYSFIYYGKTKKSAFNFSVYFSSILLFSAVTAQLKILFNLKYSFSLNLLLVISIAFILAILQWKIRGYLNYKKILFSTLKLSFIFFGLAYLIFLLIRFIKI
ncbi:hypothetical protein BHF71_09160 [Vulcanibacillus modesticaldus]|uniref:DUF3397 domain-containing protein n=1 Tax=Vulcanibacillus modesticaldus TaxID=337097 RepID=A0A1D2YU94_9BACI|nr:DUF3397 family protein [Vulcanibacillus modesticaldus]OEF99282.1 hypothetical protein BHF71_09160 [Vulcanibacillus modesticaldus]